MVPLPSKHSTIKPTCPISKHIGIITENALVPIRFRLNGMKAVLGYTQPECSTWPVIRGVTLSIRQIAEDLTACFSQATRTSNTTYDCNEKIRAYKFAYDFADAYVEEASITRFEEIISLYYPDDFEDASYSEFRKQLIDHYIYCADNNIIEWI